MISAGDFRNGVTIEFEGNIYQIIEFQHVKPGKGAAFVRTKLKNIISGGVVEKTFRPTEKCPTAHIDRYGGRSEPHLKNVRKCCRRRRAYYAAYQKVPVMSCRN